MAITPIFICGAECGLAAVGTTSPALEHWSVASATQPPTVVTSGPASMRSTRCYRIHPTNGVTILGHTFATPIGSGGTVVGRCYVYFASMPTSSTKLMDFMGGTSGFSFGAMYHQPSGTIVGGRTGSFGTGGVAVTTGQWYRIDVKVVFGATHTVDVSVDGTAATQKTEAIAAETCVDVDIGASNDAGSVTCDMYFDDICVSGTAADFPIGAGTVVGLYPSGDGSHSYSAATDFDKDGNTHTALNANPALETTSWQSLTNPLSTSIDTANYITNATGGTAEYLRWTFEDLPADAATVNGVAYVGTHHSSSATANTQALKVIDVSSGTSPEISVLGTFSGSPANTAATGVDLSEITIITVYNCAAVGETTGAWTVANVNDLGVHWSSTDVNPDPRIDGLCLECDVVLAAAAPGPAYPRRRKRGSDRLLLLGGY